LSAIPRISVCVPLFNKAAAVERCLGTVLAAHVDDMEVAVFDNGSTDGSTEIVERMAVKDKRIRHVRLGHTVTIQESWRMAFMHGRGELLKLHSGDDEMPPDFWTHMLPPLENPDVDYAMCMEKLVATENADPADMARWEGVYAEINDVCRQLLAIKDPGERARLLVLKCTIQNRMGNIYKVVVRRSCLPLDRWRAIAAGFPMPMSYPDWDFLLRLILNHRGHFVEQALSEYTITSDAPYIRIRKDPALYLADCHSLLLMVLTVLADPTLHRLRAAMTRTEIQELFDEAARRLMHTANTALAMPAPAASPR
jgi:glycosyltransferase involved in cell wall biosynthesis